MTTRPTITGPCIIVGNGPSVDEVSPAMWSQLGTTYIGTNRCLVLAACLHVPWTAIVMRDSYRSMFGDQDVGWRYHQECWIPSAAYKVGSSHDRSVHCDEYAKQSDPWHAEPTFTADREMRVMKNSSVVLMAASWAWLCGARDLRLIGVDYRSPHHARMIEPWQSAPLHNIGHYDRPVPTGIERQFKAAVDGIEAGGGTIVNYSANTKLGAVPCADLPQ